MAPNTAPILAPNGTLDIFNPEVGAGLGPGNIVQIYGSGLASQISAPSTLPLPTILNGTTVLIGGVNAPLSFQPRQALKTRRNDPDLEMGFSFATVLANRTRMAGVAIAFVGHLQALWLECDG